jgi:hypothetical protein
MVGGTSKSEGKVTTREKFTDRVAYEQWIVQLRLARIAQQEIDARKCTCPLCQELWHS